MKNTNLLSPLFMLLCIAIFTNCNKEEITNLTCTVPCDQGLARYATDAINDEFQMIVSNLQEP